VQTQYGKVKDIRLAAEGDGHAKGYAFVEYENAVCPAQLESRSLTLVFRNN
jgi:hypothetical protein